MRLPADVSLLLQTVWDTFAADAAWPVFARVDRLLYRDHDLDVSDVLRHVPVELLVGGRGHGGAPASPRDELRLTIAGAAACEGSSVVLETLVAAVAQAVLLERSADDGGDPVLTADRVVHGASDGTAKIRDDNAARLARQVGLLLINEPWAAGGSLYEGGWSVNVSRRVRAYAGASTVDAYLRRAAALASAQPSASAGEGPLPWTGMDPARAAEQLRLLAEQADSAAVRVDGAEHDAWKARAEAVMIAALGPDSTALRAFKDVGYSVGVWTGAPGEDQRDREYFAQQVDRAKAHVETALFELELRSGPAAPAAPRRRDDGPVFVVHGHDDARKYELVRLLDRATDRDAQILHEQPNKGATVLEKLERHAESAAFAVVLLTGDDEGRVAGGGDLKPRGRQNVILELGLFIGLLGRDRVAVLVDPAVERPSDLDGLVYIALDPAGAWRHALVGELEAAGIAVDRRRVP
jgi:predicted nucleotide-binding protein